MIANYDLFSALESWNLRRGNTRSCAVVVLLYHVTHTLSQFLSLIEVIFPSSELTGTLGIELSSVLTHHSRLVIL